MKIEIEHVSKKIKDALVLDDVCMTLESGNIYGFQGVNGSGKTMLMRAVSGLMYPTSGSIRIDGKVLGKNMAFPEPSAASCCRSARAEAAPESIRVTPGPQISPMMSFSKG